MTSKKLTPRKALRAILLVIALSLFLLTPQIVDSIRSAVDFEQAPTVVRRIYYAVFVDRFTLLAIISAAIILRINRRSDAGPLRDSDTLSPRQELAPLRQGHGAVDPVEFGFNDVAILALVQFAIPLLLLIHRILHGVTMAYGWGWQMYS